MRALGPHTGACSDEQAVGIVQPFGSALDGFAHFHSSPLPSRNGKFPCRQRLNPEFSILLVPILRRQFQKR
jgi:hypothetical protein